MVWIPLILISLTANTILTFELIKRSALQSSQSQQMKNKISTDLTPIDNMYVANVKIDVDFYGEMAVLLYTNKTFAAKCPPQFLLYNCTYYIHCTWNDLKPFELLLPFFNLSGYMIETEFFLGSQTGQSDEWGGGFMNVYYAQNCSGGYSSQQLYGAIGMGIDGGEYKNYLQDVSFSILFSPDGEEGYLVFGNEFTVDDQVILTNLTEGITKNWHIPIGNISLGDNSMALNATSVFDLSSNNIYIPIGYMEIIIDWLVINGITCSTDSFFNPICTVPGSPDIEPIIFQTKAGEKFEIPSSVYLQFVSDGLYNLIFVGTTSDSKVTTAKLINENYKDTIFIGSQYMYGKMIQFNFADLNSLYITISDVTIPSSVEYSDIIFGIIMAFIFSIMIITAFKIKRKTMKKWDATQNTYQPIATIVETITPGED